MIKGEIFFAEAPLDFIHFFAVASIKDAQHNEKDIVRCPFFVGCRVWVGLSVLRVIAYERSSLGEQAKRIEYPFCEVRPHKARSI